MYVGGLGSHGVHTLLHILLHAGFVAAREGRVREQSLHLEADGGVAFTVDGLLWPVRADAFERLLTQASFDPRAKPPGGAPISPVLGSIPEDLALVNALSSEFELTVWTEAGAWRQRFRCGQPVEPLTPIPHGAPAHASPVGTRIRFVPDGGLFTRVRLSGEGLAARMRQLAGLLAGFTCHLRDDVRGQQVRFHFEQGLADWCAQLTELDQPLHTPWRFEGRHEGTHVRLALQWTRRRGTGVWSWVNTYRAHGGTHVDGFASGVGRALHDVAVSLGREDDLGLFIPEVLTEGLTALLDVTVDRPVWLGPVKGRLANEDAGFEVAQLVNGWLRTAFTHHPATAEQVLERVIACYVARG